MRNEVKHPRQRLADIVPLDVPFSIYIDPCGFCNLKCRFCPCNNSDYRIEERHKKMDLDLFLKIVDDLAEFNGEVKVISLYGFGEPLMNPCVPDMVRIINERALCREIRITTNGILLSPEINKKLVDSGVDLIRISIEALSAKSYLEITGVSVDYEKFLENIRDLYNRSRGTRTKLTAKIITSDILSEEDIKIFSDVYSPLTDYQIVWQEESGWPLFDVKSKLTKNAVTRTFTKVDDSLKNICSSPFTDMMVFANGKVGACCSDWRMDTVCGDVRKESLSYIWKLKMHSFRIAHLDGKRFQIPSCRDCLIIPYDDINADAEFIKAKLINKRKI